MPEDIVGPEVLTYVAWDTAGDQVAPRRKPV
jgi:hypothetical protein